MSTIAVSVREARDADLTEDPLNWALGKAVQAAGVFALALLLGGMLYYTFNPLASAFSFLDPVQGYWNFTLVGLGLMAAWSIFSTITKGVRLDLASALDDAKGRAKLVELASGPGMILLVAYLIVEFIR